MKRIIIIGSRKRDSEDDFFEVVDAFLKIYEGHDIIISGGCPKGADRFAERISTETGVPIVIFPANWEKFGKAAGFIRNTDIARNGDVVIACVAPDRKGGTEDTIKKFKKFVPDGQIILC